MKASVDLKWTGGMSFEGEVDSFKIPLDASIDVGGNDSAPRPKKLILLALAGCTAMDVVSILEKMRVQLSDLSIAVEAEQSEGEHPYVYTQFKIIYNFKGEGLENNTDKVEKAVKLSQEKYCGVSAMLSKIGPVDYEIRINA